MSSAAYTNDERQYMTAHWPDWAVDIGNLAGKLGFYEVAYRNPDIRNSMERRWPDFAQWAYERDLVVENSRDVYVCSCPNCGSRIIDPMLRWYSPELGEGL